MAKCSEHIVNGHQALLPKCAPRSVHTALTKERIKRIQVSDSAHHLTTTGVATTEPSGQSERRAVDKSAKNLK